jgi:hypothetical protein
MSLIARLAESGILGPAVTCGHCVWVDDKDYLAELRLASRLHRLPSHELDSPHLGSRDFFRMGTQNGAAVLGLDSPVGILEPGKRADLVVLDLETMAEPYTSETHDPLDLLLYRGKAGHVHTVLVAGEVLIDDGQSTHIQREEVMRKLREAVPEDSPALFAAANALMPAPRSTIARHFRPWYAESERWQKRPYYLMNNRSAGECAGASRGGRLAARRCEDRDGPRGRPRSAPLSRFDSREPWRYPSQPGGPARKAAAGCPG